MATDSEIYKFIFQFENEEKIKTAAAAASLAEQKFEALIATLGKMDPATRAAAASVVNFNNELKNLRKESGLSHQKLLQFANIADDLQYVAEQGIRPILNNLVQLSPVIGTVAIVGDALYRNWDQLAQLWGQGHTKTQAEEMEELRKKTELTANEAERLARASNLEGKVKDLRGAKTEDQKSEEDAATKAMAEAGFGNVARGIRATAPEMVDSQGEAAEVLGRIDQLKKERDSHRAVANNRAVDGLTQQSARNRAEEVDRQIKGMTTGKDSALERARDRTAEQIAATGALPAEWAGQRGKIADLARKNPKAFGGLARGNKLADDLAAADPSAMRDKAADATNRKLDEKEAEARRKQEAKDAGEMDKAEEAGDKIAEDLAKAGDKILADVQKKFEQGGKLDRQNADLQDQLMADSMKEGRKAPDRRQSSVVGAADLAGSIQGGVGAKDKNEDVTKRQDRQIELLKRIADNNQKKAELLRFGANGDLEAN